MPKLPQRVIWILSSGQFSKYLRNWGQLDKAIWLNLVWDRRSIALLDLLTEEVFDETKHTEKISFQQQSACNNFFSYRWSPSKGCLLHQRFFGSSSIICQKANFHWENDRSPNLIFLEDFLAVLDPTYVP